MLPDPVLVTETGSWLSKAAKDISMAEHEFQATPPFLDDIALHAQQAVEKTLKAFLTWHEPSRQEAEQALSTARQVYQAVVDRLQVDVRS